MAALNLPPKPFHWRSLFNAAALQQETLRYVLVSALDLFMTYILLRQEGIVFIESNPVAGRFYADYGLKGMIYFKFGMVALVCVIAQIVVRRRPLVAKWLLNGATLAVAGVVVYSFVLLLKHGNVGELTGVLMGTDVEMEAVD
ncbi:MAG: DUF5658 family protein [Planctomycetota bacterium]